MSFNGAGTFSLVAGNPVVTGTVISSTVHNNTMSDIANNGLSNCITKDGQTTITQNIPFNNKRITGLGSATLTNDAARVDQIQNSSFINLSTVSGSNTITATAVPVPSAYVEGQVFLFEVATTNTAATTVNVSSLGAKDLYYGGAAMVGGELIAGNIAAVRYNGTQFDLLYQSGKLTSAEIINSLSITSSDNGATANPTINLVRESTTPAADDLLGIVNAKGKNDAGEEVTYGSLGFEISDPADGAETAKAYFTVIESGSPVKTYLGDKNPSVISGLVVTNNSTDLEHDIDISAGQYGETVLSSAITKRLDAAFAAGTGSGGMVGTLPASGVVYIFLISNGNDVDVYAETTNGTSPPTGWTVVKRIAVRITDSSSNLQRVIVEGAGERIKIYPYTETVDWSVTTLPATRTAFPISGVLSCPPNVSAEIVHKVTSGVATTIYMNSLLQEAISPGGDAGLSDFNTGANSTRNSMQKTVLINTDRQLGVIRAGTDINTAYVGWVVSWVEDRS